MVEAEILGRCAHVIVLRPIVAVAVIGDVGVRIRGPDMEMVAADRDLRQGKRDAHQHHHAGRADAS
jgi:hypothetical protein